MEAPSDLTNSVGSLKVERALISVSDKSGIVEFARALIKHKLTLIATGGTLQKLRDAGVEASTVESVARFPEMLDGRVKTLQPEIFAAILARKNDPIHVDQITKAGIRPIDLIVCNFYPFERSALDLKSTDSELIEMIDIGGPSIVRASSKNYESVCVVPSPAFYGDVVTELDSRGGAISLETRKKLALFAFGMVAAYDIAIYNSLSSRFGRNLFPDRFFLSAQKFEAPLYGENPNQKAIIYSLPSDYGGVPSWKQLFGDVRSYNNYLDIASSYEILKGFESSPAAATVKHGQISGFAFASALAKAYTLAHACDPEADFGNTTVLNRELDVETARMIGKNDDSAEEDASVYTEIVVAPSFDEQALEILKKKQKKKIRIIEMKSPSTFPFDVKVMESLVLVQEAQDYSKKLSVGKLTTETVNKPNPSEIQIMLGLWEIARRVESNGIVIGNGETQLVEGNQKLTALWTLGVGSFRKRNGATKIALDNAGVRSAGAYCASDGFYPFPDSVELLGQAGIKGIIQPGGSRNDKSVIEAANRYSIAMVFTHERAFKH
jgi:phosphoribosylaminoimidazolecarboxamide formyltransferase / IMP cyclohydrolase